MKKDVRIVIIEDDPNDVVRLTRELHDGGIVFESKHVNSRDAFLDALEHYQPDLILSDHGLPAFDGFKALELVRQHSPHTPFILVSGSYDHATAVELFENGAADYIYKGSLAEELVPAVKQALEDAEDLAQHAQQSTESIARLYVPPEGAPHPVKMAHTCCLSFCPRCEQLTDKDGKPKRLGDVMAEYLHALVDSALCPRCAYELHEWSG